MKPDIRSSRNDVDLIWIALGLIIFAIVLVRVSWLNDDAYITFRIVENFVNGYGPVYNVGERVQVFTHPLWMLLISGVYFLYNLLNISFPAALPFIAILISWFIIASAVAFFALQAWTRPAAFMLGLWLLLNSKAVTDYLASGLENPLTFALLAAFTYYYWKRQSNSPVLQPRALLQLSFIAGLATLNRMDTLLIFAPAIAVVWWHSPKRIRAVGSIALGFLPFILWEFFSLVYFGFLFPNTAYAKLSSGIGPMAYLHQGVLYLFNSILLDPVSILIVLTVIGLGLRGWERKITPLAAGIAIYLVYILRIGGDYMSGRFISTLVFGSVLCLVQMDLDWQSLAVPAFVVVLLVGLTAGTMPYTSDSTYRQAYIDNKGISDERAFRYPEWGLLRINRNQLLPDSAFSQGNWSRSGSREVRISGAIGVQGYLLGPDVHILDVMALADPLLARMPAMDSVHWRPGHIEREIPDGYVETLYSGKNEIEDPSLSKYYSALQNITRDPIFAAERLRTIFKFNTGYYDAYRDGFVSGK
jgi:arabinofuranosyltransferase